VSSAKSPSQPRPLVSFSKASCGYQDKIVFRDLIRDHLVEEEWDEDKETIGTVTLVYDHHVHDLMERLTDLQHHYQRLIQSTLHIHLDADQCLEVLVVRGRSGEIREIADALIATKGVKHGKLSATTTGKDFR